MPPREGAHSRRESTRPQVYTYYADYVLKNPFYEMDMPIQKGGKFCQKLDRMVAQVQDRR